MNGHGRTPPKTLSREVDEGFSDDSQAQETTTSESTITGLHPKPLTACRVLEHEELLAQAKFSGRRSTRSNVPPSKDIQSIVNMGTRQAVP